MEQHRKLYTVYYSFKAGQGHTIAKARNVKGLDIEDAIRAFRVIYPEDMTDGQGNGVTIDGIRQAN